MSRLRSLETNSLHSPFASLTPLYFSKTFLGHHLPFFLANVNNFQFSIVLRSSLKNPLEFWLILCQHVSSDRPQLSVLSNLVWWPGTHGLPIDIHIRLLPHVEPEDLPVLGVDGPGDLLQAGLDAGQGGLA